MPGEERTLILMNLSAPVVTACPDLYLGLLSPVALAEVGYLRACEVPSESLRIYREDREGRETKETLTFFLICIKLST